jgi:dihydrodipicolinate synthase/N-acetylneuraminate lyase
MVIYNFPRHTGNAVTPDILRRVRHIAVKDSAQDASLISATPCYLAGTSRRMASAVAAGAKGFVSALASCMPMLYVELEKALAEGDMERALATQDEIGVRAETLGTGNEISCIKRDLAKQLEYYPMNVRLPLLGG